METTATPPLVRAVDRIEEVVELGPDAQVDRKAIVLRPGDWDRTDPFLMMAEDWFSSVGFDWHPHRGFETVTVVLEGEAGHTDNRGGAGVLGRGDAQWMTAGRGIIHRELAHGGRPVHSLQLWLNLPPEKKLVEPRYQDLRYAAMPVAADDRAVARVFAGSSRGVDGPALTHWPVGMLDVDLEPGGRYDHDLDGAHRAFGYVLAGEVRVGDATIATGQVLWSDPVGDGPSALPIAASADGGPARVLVFHGIPIGAPVVQYGPFVMNTEHEIEDAFLAYRAGEFGPVPA
jgi:redox-sensitive bicupin YhaK (pirin superfamily)